MIKIKNEIRLILSIFFTNYGIWLIILLSIWNYLRKDLRNVHYTEAYYLVNRVFQYIWLYDIIISIAITSLAYIVYQALRNKS